MNQSVAILIDTKFELISLLKLQTATYLYKSIETLLSTIVFVKYEVS